MIWVKSVLLLFGQESQTRMLQTALQSAVRRTDCAEVKPKWSLSTGKVLKGASATEEGSQVGVEERIELLAWHMKESKFVQQMQCLSKIAELSSALQVNHGKDEKKKDI